MSKGFSLIEMVVAFTVAALVLAACAQLLALTARQAGRLQEHARAAALAESQLAQAGIGEALVPGVVSGETEALRWRRSVEPLFPRPEAAAADAGWTAYRVTVEVRWGADRSLALAGVRLGAAP